MTTSKKKAYKKSSPRTRTGRKKPAGKTGPPVTIAFEGLMFFNTLANAPVKQVVIPEAHHHEPLVRHFQGISTMQPAATFPLAGGMNVRFDVTAGAITADASYMTRVPNLRDYIVYGGLDPAVLNQTRTERINAYVTLPPGDLTVLGKLDAGAQVKFMKPGCAIDKRCMVRWVVMTTTVTELSVNGVKRSVAPGDVIVVSNTSGHPGGLHFPVAYTNVLDGNGQLGPIQLDNVLGTCGDPTTSVPPALADFLTRLPSPSGAPRNPNADCGPTGP